MSAPAEKARSPAPVRMTARTSASVSIASSTRHQAVDQRVVQRIELVGPVQRDQRDAVVDFEQEGSDIAGLR